MAKISHPSPGASALADDEEENPLDWQALFTALLRRSWIILLLAALAGLAAWSYTRRLPNLYQSVAVIQIEAHEQKAIDLRDNSQDNLQNPEVVETIIQDFASRSLMARVNKALGLATDARFLGYTPIQPASDELVTALLLSRSRAALRPRTRLIDVTFAHGDPDVAYKVTNALVDQFLLQGAEQRMNALESQNHVLVQKSQELKDKLNRSELALQDYKKKLASVSIEDRRNLVEEKLKGLNGELTNAKGERLRLESDSDQVKLARGSTEQLLAIASVVQDPQVVAAQEKLSKEEDDLAALTQRYRARHPRMIEQKAQVDAARAAYNEAVRAAPDRLGSRFTGARARENGLQRAVEEQEAALLDMDAKVIPYRALQREYDSDRTLFESVLQRLKESTLQLGVQSVDFRVAERALPAREVPSRRPLLVVAAILAGTLLAVGLIVVLFFLHLSISTVESAERLLKVPVLAAVPKMKQTADPADALVTMHRPESVEAESFRTLRSALLMLGEQAQQVILITSAIPAEGKSVSAGNIAVAFAHLGRRTLLIEADLRKPSLAPLFLPRGKEYPGVGDYLQGSPVHIEPTERENLFFLSAGCQLRNPAEMLSGPRFGQMIEQLKPNFERIIIDTAPVNVVSDTLNIVPCASVICLVVRSNSTPQKIVKRAIELLRRSGARADGVILNCVAVWRGSKYHEYYGGASRYGSADSYRESVAPAPVPAKDALTPGAMTDRPSVGRA